MALHPEMLGFTFQKNFFPESYALIKFAISRIIYIYMSSSSACNRLPQNKIIFQPEKFDC